MIGTQIRKRREQKGMTLSALATAIGCSESAVCLWESGKRRPGAWHAHQLEAVLGFASGAIAKRLGPRKGAVPHGRMVSGA